MEKQRTLLTKSIIKESLLEILKDKKIHEISIREICKKANINRATFYNYYASPKDAFIEIENGFVDAVVNELKVDAKNSDVMFEYMNKALIFLKENKEVTKVIINNVVSEDFPKRLLTFPNINNAINLTSEVAIAPHLKKYYSTYLITANFALVKLWINEGCVIDTKEISALMISLGNRNILKDNYISSNEDNSSSETLSSKNEDK